MPKLWIERTPTVLFALLLTLAIVPSAMAQNSETPAAAATETLLPVTAQMLDVRTREAESNSSLTQPERDQLLELYNKTRGAFEAIQAHEARSQRYADALLNASKQAGAIRAQNDNRHDAPPSEELRLDEDSELVQIEPRLLQEKASRTEASIRLADLKRLLVNGESRLAPIQQEVTSARKRLGEVIEDIKLRPSAEQRGELTEALQWMRQTQRQALAGEIQMLGQELLSQPVRADLLKARIDQQEGRVVQLAERVRYLEELAGQQRKRQAQQAQRQAVAAEAQASGKHPVLLGVAAENTALSELLQTVTAELQAVSMDDDRIIDQASKIEDEFRSASRKLNISGLNEALGQLLLATKRDLPDQNRLAKTRDRRERLTSEVTLRQLQHTQQHKMLRDPQNRLTELTDGLDFDDIAVLEDELTTLLLSQRELLNRFITTDNAFLRALSELELAQRRLADSVQILDKLLAKRLLWIRSEPGINTRTPSLLLSEARPLWASMDFQALPAALMQRASNSWLFIPGLLLILLLHLRSRWLYRLLRGTTEGLHKPSADSFANSALALLLTLLLAAPWPLLMWLLGWQLTQAEPATAFIDTLGGVLQWVAPVYFHLEAFRILCKPGGLAMEHFRWPRSGVDALRKRLGLLIWTFIPSSLLAALIIISSGDNTGGEWGRLSLALIMALLSLFFYKLFRPGSGVVQPFIDWAPKSPLARLRYLWLLLGTALPLVLLVLALFGYVYTTVTLLGHLVDTFWLIIALLVLQQMAVRWVMISRRRIAFRIALEKRAARLAAAEAEADGLIENPSMAIEEEQIDVVAMSEESRRMVNLLLFLAAAIGLWSIWQDVVPALGIFNDIHLWDRSTLIDGVETLQPVTLSSMLLVLLVLLFTGFMLRRQSQLLQLILIEVFDMSAASRYTVSTLSRYVVIIAASLYVFSALGVDWSKLQWLVAAMGVGIGFGLQEIVANFISGLIILFERPIRVGDVVTVGNVDGVVTRIRIRATTIRDWDNKELLVPNKEFITNQLLNWTLSDPETRLLVPVGIAYGSNVTLASELMLEAAAAQELVLPDPPPSVVFEAFGDNSLNMVLRCFIPSAELRMRTISDLNYAINDKFNAAGICIAFPQRDVHLDTGGPLEVRISRGDS